MRISSLLIYLRLFNVKCVELWWRSNVHTVGVFSVSSVSLLLLNAEPSLFFVYAALPNVFGVTGKCLFWRDGQHLLETPRKNNQHKIILETLEMWSRHVWFQNAEDAACWKITSLNTDNFPHKCWHVICSLICSVTYDRALFMQTLWFSGDYLCLQGL